jgi:hypothetical protein
MDGELLDVMLFLEPQPPGHDAALPRHDPGPSRTSERRRTRRARARGGHPLARSYPVEVEVDGDCVLETPIRCRVGTQTVRILVPSTVESLKRADMAALTTV